MGNVNIQAGQTYRLQNWFLKFTGGSAVTNYFDAVEVTFN
jgi:hypothetical protein